MSYLGKQPAFAPLVSSDITNALGYTPLQSSDLSPYLTSATASSTYQTQAGMSSYLTTSAASSTYQTQAGMSSYLTSATASSTYLTQASASSTYLTTSSASSTYAPLASPSLTGSPSIGGSGANTIPALATTLVTGELTGRNSAGSDYGLLRLSAGGGTALSGKAAIDIQGYGTTDNSQIRMYTGGTERVRLTAAGNLGVNQQSPAAKLDVSGNQAANVVAVAALSIDCSAGNYFTKTINANSTFTVSNVPASRAYAFTLELTHTSGTVTWFSGVQWPGGTAPTLTTGKVHLFTFVTDDGGTSWRGASQVNYNS